MMSYVFFYCISGICHALGTMPSSFSISLMSCSYLIIGLCIRHHQCTPLHTYIWTATACAPTLWSLATAMHQLYTHTSVLLTYTPGIILFLLPMYASIINIVSNYIFCPQAKLTGALCATMSTLGTLWFIERHGLLVLGTIEQIPLLNPALATLNNWWGQQMVQWLGTHYWSFIGSFIIYVTATNNLRSLVSIIFFVLIFSPQIDISPTTHCWCSTLSYHPHTYNINSTAAIPYCIKKLHRLLANRDKQTILLLPESSFIFPDQTSLALFVSQWQQTEPFYPLVAGCLVYTSEREYYNQAIFITANHVQVHHKGHRLPWTEYRPFFDDHSLATQAKPCVKLKAPWQLFSQEVQPLICSELLCKPTFAPSACSLLALCSDRWLMQEYAKNTVEELATLRCLTLKRPIVYITHSRAHHLLPDGTRHIIFRLAA